MMDPTDETNPFHDDHSGGPLSPASRSGSDALRPRNLGHSLEAASYLLEGSARAFQRDVFFYWSTARNHPLSLTKAGRLYRKDLRRVNGALLQPEDLEPGAGAAPPSRSANRPVRQQLDEPDIPRLLFLRLFMTDIGLLRQDGQTIYAVEDPEFLGLRPTERIRRSFDHWRTGTFWNEVLSIPNITVVSGRGAADRGRSDDIDSRMEPAPQQIVRAREQVLQHIARVGRPTHPQAAQESSADGTSDLEAKQGWVSIAQLLDQIYRTDYDFLLPRGYRPFRSGRASEHIPSRSPYISYGNEMGWTFSPAFPDERGGWRVVEAGFIQAILLEPMYWMGLVDVGLAHDRPAAYRLTPVGAWMLGIGPEVQIPEEEGRVIVQPNFEIIALDPISDRTLAILDEFAERVSAERAIRYHLTRESVYRAQRQGWTSRRILCTLERLIGVPRSSDQGAGSQLAWTVPGPANGTERGTDADALRPTLYSPLPQNVVRTLQDWQHLHERITIHRHASLLQAVDPDLLAQLMDNPAIREHLATGSRGTEARIGVQVEDEGQEAADRSPTVSLIARGLGHTGALVRTLQNAGYPPARTRAPRGHVPASSATAQAFEIRGKGELCFSIPIPSLYVLEQIAPFTLREDPDDQSAPGPNSRYCITMSSVQNALEDGMSLEEILRRLRSLHVGGLPRSIETQVRAWGHYYGDAAVQKVTLVQLRDQETLEELLQEPRLRNVLRRFTPEETKALAVVSPEDLQLLYELLAEHGMEISEELR